MSTQFLFNYDQLWYIVLLRKVTGKVTHRNSSRWRHPDNHRSGFVPMWVVDVLVPSRHQNISKHHADFPPNYAPAPFTISRNIRLLNKLWLREIGWSPTDWIFYHWRVMSQADVPFMFIWQEINLLSPANSFVGFLERLFVFTSSRTYYI